MSQKPSGYALVKNSLYETEAYGTQALLRYLSVAGKKVWEPAAGNHHISDQLKLAGAEVYSSDIERYARSHDQIYDFLTDDLPPPILFDMIITNPPYGRGNHVARKFCDAALARCDGTVALLLPACFDFGKTRAHLFRDNPRFAMKIAFLDRLMWFQGPGAQLGTQDHAWYVWRATSASPNPPSMHWIDRVHVLGGSSED